MPFPIPRTGCRIIFVHGQRLGSTEDGVKDLLNPPGMAPGSLLGEFQKIMDLADMKATG